MTRGKLLLFAILPPFLLLGVSTLTFYFGNRGEYPFSLREAVPFLAVGLLGLWAALAAVLLALARWPRAQRIVAGLCLGTATAIWIQSQLLVWGFGPLDGRGIDWERWSAHGVVETVIWGLALAAGILVVAFRRRAAPRAATALLLLGTGSILVEALLAPQPARYEDDHRVFSLHPENNTLLIVLDTFQSDALQEIIDRWPREVDFLEGFTFYRNALGGFPTTIASIPLLLTAESYDNQEPVHEFIRRVNQDRNIARFFYAKGYESTFTSSLSAGLFNFNHLPTDYGDSVPMQRVLLDPASIGYRGALNLIDAGLFRAVPVWAKPSIYREGDWLLTRLPGDPEIPPDFHGVDIQFAEAFLRLARTDLEAHGAFKFIHFGTPHFPLRIDENLRHVPDVERSRETYLAQARGGLQILRRVLARLRHLGVYESSQILVVSDHGTRSIPVQIDGELPRWGWVPELSTRAHASSLPIFLYKPAGATGALEISDNPVHLGDVPCFLAGGSGLYDCSKLEGALAGADRTRYFYDYPWRHEYWERRYLPTMTRFRVEGHAWDLSAWTDTRIRLAREGITELPPVPEYAVGETIEFRHGGTSERFAQFGWSYPEERYRWIVGGEAGLLVPLAEVRSQDLLMTVQAHPFRVPRLIDAQHVRVTANGVEVARWEMLRGGTYTALIPHYLSASGELRLVFEISHPARPKDHGESTDGRELGIAVHRMTLAWHDGAATGEADTPAPPATPQGPGRRSSR